MVRIISFSLCVAVISLGFVIVVWTRLVGYRQSVENVYQRAFTGLCASISGIDYSLQKSLYSNSPVMLASLSGRIYSDAASAVGALSELPFTDLRLNQTSKFLSQVGDYARSVKTRRVKRRSYRKGQTNPVGAIENRLGIKFGLKRLKQ